MLDWLSLSYNNISYKYNKLTKGQQKKEKKIEHERTCEQPTSVVPILAFFHFYIKKTKFQKYMPNREIFKNGCLSPIQLATGPKC